MAQQVAQVKGLWPLLRVREMQRSLAFYQHQLGFTLAAKAAGDDGAIFWCRLTLGDASLMLEQGTDEDSPSDTWGGGISFYFICDDVDILHADLKSRGLTLPAPQTAYYGMKQLYLSDPDNYQLCFESETHSAAAGAEDGGESE